MVNATDPTEVYIHRSDTEVLYVGITGNYRTRTDQHRRAGVPWVAERTHTEVWSAPTREIALVVEMMLIKVLRPKYNVQHNERPLITVSVPPPIPPLLPPVPDLFDETDPEHRRILASPESRFAADYGWAGDGGLESYDTYVAEWLECAPDEHDWEKIEDDAWGWWKCAVCGVWHGDRSRNGAGAQ